MTWELENTRERRVQRVKTSVSIMVDDNPPTYQGAGNFQERYMLSKTVRTSFWSNADQLPHAHKQAEQMANAYFYKDMIPLVHEILADTDCDDVRITAVTLLDMMKG